LQFLCFRENSGFFRVFAKIKIGFGSGLGGSGSGRVRVFNFGLGSGSGLIFDPDAQPYDTQQRGRPTTGIAGQTKLFIYLCIYLLFYLAEISGVLEYLAEFLVSQFVFWKQWVNVVADLAALECSNFLFSLN